MSVHTPPRLKLGPMREQYQQREAVYSVDQQVEHFEGSRIGPMHVLVQHDAGLLARSRFSEVDQAAQRLVLMLLRGHGERAVALFAGNRQDRGNEANVGKRAFVMGD